MALSRTVDPSLADQQLTNRGGKHVWPQYLVSAPHAKTTGGDQGLPQTPYGAWHARQVGSLQTLCGRSAVTWRYFWTLDFDDAGSSRCPECEQVMRQRGHSRRANR